MSAARWRLILGHYAGSRLGALTGVDAQRDDALDYLYRREYGQQRGIREGQTGSLEPSQITAVEWLGKIRELFPKECVEVIEAHALTRYGLTELLNDPSVLETLQPNEALLRTLLSVRTKLHSDVIATARRIIRQVVNEIRRKLETEVRATLSGRRNRLRASPVVVAQNFDALGTVRRNLKHFNRERQQLVIEHARFFDRNARRLPWDVILCVDQSGSMVDSVIHSAVMAGILCALPALRVRLVLFDTDVVDLSAHVDDPVEVLMRAQLGGGTDIARALRYCAGRIENPQRTVLILITDFFEGGAPSALLRITQQLLADRVRLIGLASLADSQSHFDRHMADQLAALGMPIAALTPRELARWLVQVIS